MVSGLDIGKQVSDSVAGLRTTLTGITDVASAQAALPKLQDLSVQVDKVGRVVGQFSREQRQIVAGMVNPVMPTLNQLFDKLLAIPGVAEILEADDRQPERKARDSGHLIFASETDASIAGTSPAVDGAGLSKTDEDTM